MATGDNQLSDWANKKLQRHICIKKGHGHCLVICCPSDPWQLPEFQRNHYIWEYAQQIDETHWKLQCLQPAPINKKGPILHDNAQPHITQPTLQKLNKSCYKVLPHQPYSPDLSPNQLPLLQASQQLFAWKMLPQPEGRGKCFPRAGWIVKHGFLRHRNKLIFHW